MVLERLLQLPWRPGMFFNVNMPACAPEQVKGIRATRQGLRPAGSFKPVRRVDERHVPYYWIKIAFPDGGYSEGNDLQAIKQGEVSVTPLQLDMTAHGLIPEVSRLFQN